MAKAPKKVAPAGELVETSTRLTVSELCVMCNVEETWVSELIAHGAIDTARAAKGSWSVSAATVVRVKKARRLARDFEMNASSVALALDLLDEIDRLRAHIRTLTPRTEPSDASFKR